METLEIAYCKTTPSSVRGDYGKAKGFEFEIGFVQKT